MHNASAFAGLNPAGEGSCTTAVNYIIPPVYTRPPGVLHDSVWPVGIPLSCKGRTLRDGIEDVHNLGLTAMEVQLVRAHLNERFASEEDVGHTIREIPGELIVRVGRPEDHGTMFFSDF